MIMVESQDVTRLMIMVDSPGDRQNGRGVHGQSVEDMLCSIQGQMAQLVSSIQALEARQKGRGAGWKSAWPEDEKRQADPTALRSLPHASYDGSSRPPPGDRVGEVEGEDRQGIPLGSNAVGLRPSRAASEEALPAPGSVMEPEDARPHRAFHLAVIPPRGLHNRASMRSRRLEAMGEQQEEEQGLSADVVVGGDEDDRDSKQQTSAQCGRIPRLCATYSGGSSRRDGEGRGPGSSGSSSGPDGVGCGTQEVGSNSSWEGVKGSKSGKGGSPAPWDAAGAGALDREGKGAEIVHPYALHQVEGNSSEDATVTASSLSSPQGTSAEACATKQGHFGPADPHSLSSCLHSPIAPQVNRGSTTVQISGLDLLLEGGEGEEKDSTHKVPPKSIGSDTDEVLQSDQEDLKESYSLREGLEKGDSAPTRWQRAWALIKYLVWDVLGPDDYFRIFWDTINVFAILYAIIITPYIVGFEIDTAGHGHALAIVDLIINVFFMTDVLFTFRTAYISDEGDVVSNRLQIAGRYLMFWFWVDSVASIPWDLALASETNLLMLLRLTRTTRVMRIIKVLRTLRMVKAFKIGQLFLWFEELLGRQRLSITYFVLTVVCCLHWVACLYFFLAAVSDFPEDSWVVRLGIENETNLFKYITSVYWAVSTMTTVGYGDITATRIEEKIVASFVMALGSSMFAYMMGSVATLIANSNELQARMTRQMFAIDRFAKTHRIPPQLVSQVRAFYAYRMEKETQAEENDILMGLTDSLRSQLTLYVYKDLLDKIPFFKDKGASFITAIVPHLHPVYASPGDIIVFQGAEGHEIYFLLEGKLEARLYSDADQFLAKSKDSISFARAGSCSAADLATSIGKRRLEGDPAEVPSPHPRPRSKRVSRTGGGEHFQPKRKDASEDDDRTSKQASGLRRTSTVRRPHVDPEMWSPVGGKGGKQRPPTHKDAAGKKVRGALSGGQPVAEAQVHPPLYVHHRQRQRQQATLLPPGDDAGDDAALFVQGRGCEARRCDASESEDGWGGPALQDQQDLRAQDHLLPSFQHNCWPPTQWHQQQQQQYGQPRQWPFRPECWRPWSHVQQPARVVPEGAGPVAEGLLSRTPSIHELVRQQVEGPEGRQSGNHQVVGPEGRQSGNHQIVGPEGRRSGNHQVVGPEGRRSGNHQVVDQCDTGQLPMRPFGGASHVSTLIAGGGEGGSSFGASPGARRPQAIPMGAGAAAVVSNNNMPSSLMPSLPSLNTGAALGIDNGSISRRRGSLCLTESFERRGRTCEMQAIPMGAGAAAVVSNNNVSSGLLPSRPSLNTGGGGAFNANASREKARAALLEGEGLKVSLLPGSFTGFSGGTSGKLPLVRNPCHGRKDEETHPPSTSSRQPATGSGDKHPHHASQKVSSGPAAASEEAHVRPNGSFHLPQLPPDALETQEHGTPDPAAPAGSKYIVLNSYHPGDNFGEVACLRRRPNPATVVAVDLCYMYCLQREDLEAVIQLWPELQTELGRMVLHGQRGLMARHQQKDYLVYLHQQKD